MWLRRGSNIGLLCGRKCTIGFRKTQHFTLIRWGTTSAGRRKCHIGIIHTVKKEKRSSYLMYVQRGQRCMYVHTMRTCGSRILKVIRELRDYCWRSFRFYAFVIAKNVVSLCLLQPQVLLKAFVMEIWRHLSKWVSWTFFPKVLWYWKWFSLYFVSDLC